MRILIVANKMPYPPKDGGTIATLTLAMSLRRCGCEVDVLAMNTPKHFCKVEDIPAKISTAINFYAVGVNTAIRPAKALGNLLFSSKPYNAVRFIDAGFSEKLKAMLSAKEYDVVQLEGLYLCPYIESIRKSCSARIALRAHNVEHEIWQRMVENENSFSKRAYKRIIAKRMRSFELSYINTYDFLVPITSRDAAFFQTNGNRKPSFVTPTGIESDSPLLSIDTGKSDYPGFSYIGALDWHPNCEGLRWFVENVWTVYRSRHPEAHFRVAGRNASSAFADFLMDNAVDYVGEVENAADFYASGSVFIVPLMSGSGMRIKVVEAMAAGKTVVTTPIGTEGIATENERNILVANDAEAFLRYMEMLENNHVVHERISKEARSFVLSNYDNDVIARRLLNFYSENLKV